MYHQNLGWQGYADAKPSESIQKHELPGIAVAVVFPYHPEEGLLDIPVKQYKECKLKKKAFAARRLSEWLIQKREGGLILEGFVNSHTQKTAATLGMELIQELPCTHVEPHYDSFRLNFDGEYIDLAHAIALHYYYFTISFGILRAGQRLKTEQRRVTIALDRFPGVSRGALKPGEAAPITQGLKFINFIRTRSATGKGLIAQDRRVGLESSLGTLDWWRISGSPIFRPGKTHPHFVLPDWLAASTIAHKFHDDFADSIKKEKFREDIIDALINLYSVFRTFRIWSMGDEVPLHIKSEEKLWAIPKEARNFILSRTE